MLTRLNNIYWKYISKVCNMCITYLLSMEIGDDGHGKIKKDYKIFNFRNFRWNFVDLS